MIDNDSHYQLTAWYHVLKYAMIIVFGAKDTILTMFKLHSKSDRSIGKNKKPSVPENKQEIKRG